MNELDKLEKDLLSKISQITNLADLEKIRVSALGKKGNISVMMKTLVSLGPEERKSLGKVFNELKLKIETELEKRKRFISTAELSSRLKQEWIDVTLPVKPQESGRIHPVSQVVDEIISIFSDMGFSVAEGPDIEDDFHNFAALNIPPEHPARQMHDTFYLSPPEDGDRLVLRTHTSPVQIRHMQNVKPPYRIIAPGRVFRCDSDQTHTPMFHQVEGLVIDKNIHMGHLKGCLEDFVRTIFNIENLTFRFRPSYFPFTEPSVEMDICCSRDKGNIRIGEGRDWLEILGCGMVHPRVLQSVGVDPNEWQGFAFGLGIDRIAMLKYGIPDLRAFFESDVRWLQHYGFRPFHIPNLVSRAT